MKKISVDRVIMLAVFAILPFSSTAGADQFTWTGAADSDFNNPGNWVNETQGGTGVPGINDAAAIGDSFTVDVATATVDGSAVTTGDVSIGFAGAGALTVTDASTFTSHDLTVGDNGTGTLEVDTASTVTTNGNAVIGNQENSSGTANITDNGTAWTVWGVLTVGGDGAGSLTIANDAQLFMNGPQIYIGLNQGSTGTFTISGTNSNLFYFGDTSVGLDGTGTLALQAGASYDAPHINLAVDPGSSGTINIDGASTLTIDSDFIAGQDGTATINVTNASSLILSGNATLSENSDSSASVIVDTASTLQVAGALTVASAGNAALIVQGGGQLNAAGNLTIAEQPGSFGELSIDGAGSAVHCATLNAGGSTQGGAIGGIAEVTLSNQGQLFIANTLNTFDGTILDTTGGSVTLGADTPAADSGSLRINTGGLLTGSGSISGAVNQTAGGILAFHSDNTTLTISGPFTWSGGVINGDGDILAASGMSIFNSVQKSGIGVLRIFNSLSLAAGATLDLTISSLVFTHPAGYDIAPLIDDIASGYAAGHWDGVGITSSTAASMPGVALGYDDDGTTFTIRYTWYGDANLDGVVNAADLAAMKSNGTTWSTGDFNYDGVVNADDYSLFAYAAALSGGRLIPVPEPASIALFLFLPAWRRRHG